MKKVIVLLAISPYIHINNCMNEKTPLLAHKKTEYYSDPTNNSSLNYIQMAIVLLQKANLSLIVEEFTKDMNKYMSARNDIVKKYLEKFESQVKYYKENFVSIDKNGNIFSSPPHKLEPVIAVLKKYLGINV